MKRHIRRQPLPNVPDNAIDAASPSAPNVALADLVEANTSVRGKKVKDDVNVRDQKSRRISEITPHAFYYDLSKGLYPQEKLEEMEKLYKNSYKDKWEKELHKDFYKVMYSRLTPSAFTSFIPMVVTTDEKNARKLRLICGLSEYHHAVASVSADKAIPTVEIRNLGEAVIFKLVVLDMLRGCLVGKNPEFRRAFIALSAFQKFPELVREVFHSKTVSEFVRKLGIAPSLLTRLQDLINKGDMNTVHRLMRGEQAPREKRKAESANGVAHQEEKILPPADEINPESIAPAATDGAALRMQKVVLMLTHEKNTGSSAPVATPTEQSTPGGDSEDDQLTLFDDRRGGGSS